MRWGRCSRVRLKGMYTTAVNRLDKCRELRTESHRSERTPHGPTCSHTCRAATSRDNCEVERRSDCTIGAHIPQSQPHVTCAHLALVEGHGALHGHARPLDWLCASGMVEHSAVGVREGERPGMVHAEQDKVAVVEVPTEPHATTRPAAPERPRASASRTPTWIARS